MRLHRHIWILVLWLLAQSCKEKYIPKLNDPITGYLVVEGYISSGVDPTVITLSHSGQLRNSSSDLIKEAKAIVIIESKSGTKKITLTETVQGTYSAQTVLDPKDQYRVYIKTLAGGEYASDYSSVRTTPDIDSVAWRKENGGVQIYANTHDALNKTRYYHFMYDEVWEFHSANLTYLKIVNDRSGFRDHVEYINPVSPNFDYTQYYCWKSFSSQAILVNSTDNLSADIVNMFPVLFIEAGSWRISELYSILLKQRAMSKEAFGFYQQLRRNTELIGSIFDAQPSDNYGNLHSVNNPAEKVIGFIEVSEQKEKRIFIDRKKEIPEWNYIDKACLDTLVEAGNTQAELRGKAAGLLPVQDAPSVNGSRAPLTVILFALPECVDCRLRGSNVRPSYWPR